MIRSPNPEQLSAIEHKGGVSLSAGAGSGKTFVLVEHIVYLIKSIKYPENVIVENYLREYLNSLVIITFTKKAAGELKGRLYKRIEEEILQNPNDKKWAYSLNSLDSMTIGTIHSFCFKLLKLGFVDGISSDVNIVDEVVIRAKISYLIDRWFNQDEKLSGPISLYKNAIKDTCFKIFSRPEVRLEYLGKGIKEPDPFDIFKEIFDYLELTDTFTNIPNIEISKKPKVWEKFHASLRSEGWWELPNDIASLDRLLLGLSTFRKPTSKSLKEDLVLMDFFDSVKKIKDFLKKYEESFRVFGVNEDSRQQWSKSILDSLYYVEKNYLIDGEISFSDIEYYVRKGFETSDIDAIKGIFKYFVIDEFQDTSEIQYEIFKKIIEKDLSNLFIVGDSKQAIYGFRGGDVSVFEKAINNIPRSLSLKRNYRSHQKVVDFNNDFFEFLLSKGRQFSGIDRQKIIIESQESQSEDIGSVKLISVNVQDRELDTYMYQQVEAETISSAIVDGTLNGDICVLYKTLSPSSFLVKEFIAKKISFVAQMKISFDDDPIIYVFIRLLKIQISNELSSKDEFNKNIDVIEKEMKDLLSLISFGPSDIKNLIHSYLANLNRFGQSFSIRKFFFDLGVSNSNYHNNEEIIEALLGSFEQSTEKKLLLTERSDFRYSIDFTFNGDTNSNITIMTTHASKGLEFDHVIVAGMAFNSRGAPGAKRFSGDTPHEYSYALEEDPFTFYKTPALIKREILEKDKEFSESKRLFYVACTRAVKQLSFIEIKNNTGKIPSFLKESWQSGLIHYIEHNQSKIETIEYELVSESFNVTSLKTPVIQKDNLGILERENKEERLALISEISVSKLSTIISCPHKFYLESICKIEEDLSKELGVEEKNIQSFGRESTISSTSERGTRLHDLINFYLTGKELPQVSEAELKIVKWVEEVVGSCEFKSEEEIKFELFGQMITGIVDLIITDNNTPIEVWDFKSGSRTSEKDEIYLFQVMIYALGLSQINKFSENSNLRLKLLYLDTQEIVEKTYSYSELLDEVYHYWKLVEYYPPNKQHCLKCNYQNLCEYFDTDFV